MQHIVKVRHIKTRESWEGDCGSCPFFVVVPDRGNMKKDEAEARRHAAFHEERRNGRSGR